MPTIIELGQKITEDRAEAMRILAEAPRKKGADGVESPDLTNELFSKVSEIRDRLDTNVKHFEAVKAAEKGWNLLGEPAPLHMGGAPQAKSLMDQLAEAGYKSRQDGNSRISIETGAKALLSTAMTAGSGIAPLADRTPGTLDLSEVRPTGALSLIPVGASTVSTAVSYSRETTTVNAATTVEEGLNKPEATLVFDTISTLIPTIAVWISATRQQLSSVAEMRALIENRLGKMVYGRLEQQAYTGDGSTAGNLQNMVGIYNTAGINTPAAVPIPGAGIPARNILDQILPAISAVESSSVDGSVTVNGIVVNPADWYALVGTKDSTGRYLFGDPSQMAGKRFFGIEGRTSSAMAAGTGLVGDFDDCALRYREGLTTYVSDSHSDNFVKNILVFLVELSAIVEVYRTASFSRIAPLAV